MFDIVCEALIQAPPRAVYDLVADLDRYAEWNPWIFEASGGPATSGRIVTMTVRLGRRSMVVRHVVKVSEAGRRLVWRDMGWFTWLASGERARDLTIEPGGTRYRVALTITGPFSWLVRWWLGATLEAGMREETAALARAAEARVHEVSA